MNKKINVYINGIYQYSTCKFKTCAAAIKEARAAKHIHVAGIPDKYITVYDYDRVTAHYAQ